MFLPDGTMRFYISDGNSGVESPPPKHPHMWCVDSQDLGVTWSKPMKLSFNGFMPPGVNWAQVMVVDAALVPAGSGQAGSAAAASAGAAWASAGSAGVRPVTAPPFAGLF